MEVSKFASDREIESINRAAIFATAALAFWAFSPTAMNGCHYIVGALAGAGSLLLPSNHLNGFAKRHIQFLFRWPAEAPAAAASSASASIDGVEGRDERKED